MEPSTNRFNADRKWCPTCDDYVAYLMSISASYCAECGGEVRLFNKEDWEKISDTIKSRRPGARRHTNTSKPRRNAG